MSKERSCETCRHWISLCAEFDDPLEPDNYGTCRLWQECRRDDETCEKHEDSESTLEGMTE